MMRVYPDTLRREVIEAVRSAPYSLNAIAKAYGIGCIVTIERWARRAGVDLPPGTVRQRFGSVEGARRRWGDFERRRRRARMMRERGASLRAIAQRVGYRTTAGALFAVRAANPKADGK